MQEQNTFSNFTELSLETHEENIVIHNPRLKIHKFINRARRPMSTFLGK